MSNLPIFIRLIRQLLRKTAHQNPTSYKTRYM